MDLHFSGPTQDRYLQPLIPKKEGVYDKIVAFLKPVLVNLFHLFYLMVVRCATGEKSVRVPALLRRRDVDCFIVLW